jgi:glutamine amidotransferase
VIAIVDYGAGNLTSVAKALEHLGLECAMTNDPDIVGRADKWIIPGVGNFKATAPLTNGKLGAVLRGATGDDGRPLLGICLGLQWMFEGSTEAPELRGLATFPGECKRFSEQVKSPHVGWDSIVIDGRSRLLAGISSGAYVCNYEAPFTAAAERGNLFGVQFHPEKSGDIGLQILENFCGL